MTKPSPREHELTAAVLRELLSYDAETGVFRWSRSPSRRVPAGSVAGCIEGGYRKIRINGRNFRANRLAWLYMTGEWPTALVDHRNLIRDDNRWSNLRNSTQSENQANSRPRTPHLKGSSYKKDHRKFRAMIGHKRKRIFLGYFDTPEAAHAAYLQAAIRLYGEYARAA